MFMYMPTFVRSVSLIVYIDQCERENMFSRIYVIIF